MLWLIKNDGDGCCLHAESEVVMEDEWIVPKNIRQVGESAGNIHIYIEDYAVTFISQFVKTIGAGAGMGACSGRIYEKPDHTDIVIEGIAVSEKRAEGIEQLFLEESYRQVQKACIADFCGQRILGRFIADTETQHVPDERIREMLLEMGGTSPKTNIVLMADREEGIRGIWVTAYGVVQKVESYYIYYDRNESMQNYLIRWNEMLHRGAVKKEEEIREQKEIQNIIAYRRQTSFPVMEGLACALLAMVCGLGIVSINNYQKMQHVEDYIEGIARTFYERDQDGQAETVQEQSGAEVNENRDITVDGAADGIQDLPVYVPGGTSSAGTQNPVITEIPALTETPIPTESENPIAAQETARGETVTAQPAEAEAPTQEPVPTDDVMQTVTYREYIVEQGDTLSSICYRFYQDRSKVDEVCTLNGITDPDRLAVGQKILLP